MTAEHVLGIGPVVSGSAPYTAWCTASAVWSSYYRDYDVYVHSNQYDVKAVATASNGASDYWWTNRSGYADIYLYHAGSGETVKVTAGAAACYTRT